MSESQSREVRNSEIRRAYQQCQRARALWMSVRGRTADGANREQAHATLHESVMSWFEVLVPYVAERPGQVKQLWEGAPLYPVEPVTEVIWRCPNGHEFHDTGDRSGGDQCGDCGLPLERLERQKTDDAGRELMWWQQGLKNLSAWSNKTVEVQVDGGEFSSSQRTEERPKRLPPEVLMRCGRYLDLAAEQAGLLAETDKALPTGEL